jgi:hypothetical protein
MFEDDRSSRGVFIVTDQLRCASDDLLPGLARRAAQIERTNDAVRLTFMPASGLLPRIAATLDAERDCCRFLHFTLDVPSGGGDFSLTVSGPAGTGAFLESLGPEFAAPAR